MRRLILFLFILASWSTASAQLTYKDVAGIFFTRCTSCHHEGGAGPFALMNYTQTTQQTTGIFDALNDGTMPPWSPDTTYTRFLHERIRTDTEKTAIRNRISYGAFQGDTILAHPASVYSGYRLIDTLSQNCIYLRG